MITCGGRWIAARRVGDDSRGEERLTLMLCVMQAVPVCAEHAVASITGSSIESAW
jgi:hypothetical protein